MDRRAQDAAVWTSGQNRPLLPPEFSVIQMLLLWVMSSQPLASLWSAPPLSHTEHGQTWVVYNHVNLHLRRKPAAQHSQKEVGPPWSRITISISWQSLLPNPSAYQELIILETLSHMFTCGPHGNLEVNISISWKLGRSSKHHKARHHTQFCLKVSRSWSLLGTTPGYKPDTTLFHYSCYLKCDSTHPFLCQPISRVLHD